MSLAFREKSEMVGILTRSSFLNFRYIPGPYWLCKRDPEIGTSSIDWAQLSRFHLRTETESSLRTAVF
jgi:hypothetical protein